MTTPAVIQPELKDISLQGGVNESFRKEALDWTKYFTKLENLVVDDYGALSKRNGRQIVAMYGGTSVGDDSGGSLTKYLRAHQMSSGLAVTCTDAFTAPITLSLYQYNESKDTLTKSGRMPEFGVNQISVPPSQHDSASLYSTSGSFGTDCGAVAVAGDYMAVAIRSPGTATKLYLLDKNSNSVVRGYTFGSATSPAALFIVTVGTDFHIYVDQAAPAFYRLPTSTLTLSGSTALAFPAGTVQGAVALPDGSGSVVLTCEYTINSYLQKFNTSGVSVATATLAVSDMNGIDVDGNSQVYIAGIVTASGRVRVSRYNASLVLQSTLTDAATAPTTYSPVRIAVNWAGTAGIIVGWRARTVAGLNGPSLDVWSYDPAVAAVVALKGTISHWTEASIPFFSNTTHRYYVALTKVAHSQVGVGGGVNTFTRDTFGRTALVDITEACNTPGATTEPHFRPVASLGGYNQLNDIGDIGLSGALWNSGSFAGCSPKPFCASPSVGADWFIPTTFKATATSVGHSINVLTAFNAKYAGNADRCLSGGLVAYADGNVANEIGWVDRPSVAVETGIAGGPTAGSRNYVAVYEFVGTDGQVHYSQTSPVSNWTNTGSNKIAVHVTLPTVTSRDNSASVRCLIYRTVASGTTYYLLTAITVPIGAYTTYPLTYLGYTDTMSDATLAARAIMYRQGGTSGTALDRYAPLASQAICQHKDRTIISNGSNIYYSSYKVDNEAPWFNPAFSIYVPGGSGDITGLTSMDGQLFIFKRDGIWVVDGDGPPENGGTGTEFTPPRRLRTEFGCIDQRTVVVTPIGIMYRSNRGIELLEPNGKVNWIGEPVKDTVNSNPYSGTPAVDRSNGRVLFPMGDTEGGYPGLLIYDGAQTSNGITVVYDLSAGIWTTANYLGGNPGETGAYVQDYVYSRYGGQDTLMSLGAAALAYHGPETHLDNIATYAPFILETGWIKWDSIQDRVRVTDLLMLCKKVTNHNLTVSVAYDYSDTYSYSKTWTPADINGLSLEQLELQIPKQVNQAVRFKITDSEPADTTTYPVTTGKGPDIIGLTVKIGHKGGGAKLASGSKG